MTQQTYDDLYPAALDAVLAGWLDDDARHGYDYEQNVKSAADALCNTWSDDVVFAAVWADRAIARLRGE